MLKSWEELPTIFLSSSVNKNGKDELLEFVEKTNALFQ
jgi:hypothetical protein